MGNDPARLPSAVLSRLKSNFSGKIVDQLHPSYESGRHVWNGMVDKRPLLITRPADTNDVTAVIRLAQEHGLRLAVRGGGHNVAGSGTCDGGIVLDLASLRAIEVDPAEMTVKAGGGATWAQLDAATYNFGLATTGGMVSSTGIGGLTLGGGLGWLMRAQGLACDRLISAKVVTAQSKLITVNTHHHADLFWALRGGGGNFGAIISFTYRLDPVDTVLGGVLLYSIESAHEVLTHWHQYCSATPDEITTAAAFAVTPAAPGIATELHGRPALMIALCAIGDPVRADKAIASLREVGPPIADLLGRMPYPTLQASLDAGSPPGARNYWKANYLRNLPESIDHIIDYASNAPSHLSQVLIHQMGGAVSRIADDATAFGFRADPYLINIAGMWSDPADDDRNISWVRQFWQALPAETEGTYVNYLDEDDIQRVPSAYYPGAWRRLTSVKQQWDPENVFRASQNIPPYDGR